MNEFIVILKKENDLYGELLKTSKKKQQYIIENNIGGLEKLNEFEKNLVVSLTLLENERSAFVNSKLKALGCEDDKVALADIIEDFNEEDRAFVGENAKELEATILELKETNKANTELISQALKMINVSMGIMTEANEKSNYSKDKKNTRNARNLFDKKI